MRITSYFVAGLALPVLSLSNTSALAQERCAAGSELGEAVATEAIDLVWSSTYVGLDLLTEGTDQLVAYYNATRNIVVAHRKTTTNQAFYGSVWNFKQLDTMLGWDNHNSVVLGVSSDGHFHVMGNMHADRIVYYKTTQSGEIRSLERVPVMADPQLERRVTYPRFLRSGNGKLFVRFRVGGSGNGNEIYYRYDDKTGEWSTVFKDGFTDGEGQRNAYFSEPVRGPDGRFHMAWVWRSSGGSTMNSIVSYARTSDFERWEDAFGNEIDLPLLYAQTPVAAPVPDDSGMVNGHQKVGFDPDGRPLITYVRYDENRIAQAYLARFEDTGWTQHQITQLDRVTHHTNRRGKLSPSSVEMRLPPTPHADGTVSVDIGLFGQPRRLILDADTLQPLTTCARDASPASLTPWLANDDNRLRFRWMESRGTPSDTDHRVFMTWHSMPGNRDRAFEDITSPTTLRVHVVKAARAH